MIVFDMINKRCTAQDFEVMCDELATATAEQRSNVLLNIAKLLDALNSTENSAT